MDRWQEKAEERAENPLFYRRPNHRCCWPMWGDRTRWEEKRVCGAIVSAGSKIPYCVEHLERSGGTKLAVKTGGFFLAPLKAKHGA
jgi:hypothetical protein